MNTARIKILLYFALFWVLLGLNSPAARAQEVRIELGPNKIPINEYFTISLTLRDLPLQKYGDFPEITGFKKSTRTNTTSRIRLGNKNIIEQTITQRYAALQEGKFTLPPFSIMVNSRQVAAKGTVITILPMPDEGVAPDLPAVTESPLTVPPAVTPFTSESFLSLETDKEIIYVGEALYVRLAFYLAEAEQGVLDFYNFNQQYPEFNKQLRQKNAWEENFESETEIKPDTIIIRDKQFLKFNLFRQMLYPLQATELAFPEVLLQMEHQTEPANLVRFTSRPKNITVKPLPPHPLRDVVPVGQYSLKEALNRTTFRTGQTFNYRFEVTGNGNLGALLPPALPPQAGLAIYPPEIKLSQNLIGGALRGTKSFRYNLLARQPGQYNLGKLFWLVYFNPATSRYDTLRSELVVNVRKGEPGQRTYEPEASDPFYKLIREEENKLISLNQFNEIKLYTNVVILSLLCISLYLFFKKR